MDDTATMAMGPQPDGEDGSRPTTLLPASHLLRISAYWLGLTAIDSAVRKPVIYVSCAIGAVAMLLGALAPNLAVAYLAALLYGIGGGVFIAVDWALMTDIIPRASSGRYMGLSNVATGASSPVSVAVGGIIADIVNRAAGMGVGMRVSLLVALGLYVLAAVALRPVVEPRRGRAARRDAAIVG